MCWALLLFVIPTAGVAADRTPFEPADLFRLSMVTEPQISPDGRRVAFNRAFFDSVTDKRRNEIWLADVGPQGLSNRRLLIPAAANPTSVRWSPEGRRIAYVGKVGDKPQVHVLDAATGAGRALTDLRTAPGSISWSPDGARIAFVAQIDAAPIRVRGMPQPPKGATWAEPAKVITTVRYRTDELGYRAPGYRHIFVVPSEGGASRQITEGDVDHVQEDGRLSWTPDGRSIVAASPVGPSADLAPLAPRDYDILAFPVAGGEPRRLTSTPGTESDPAVSPDGRWVAYLGGPDQPHFYAQKDLWIVPFAGGPARKVSAPVDRRIELPAWRADSRALTYLYFDHGVARVGQIGIAAGAAPRTLVEQTGGTRLYLPSSFSSYSIADDGSIAFPTLYADRPTGLGIVRNGRTIANLDLNEDWRRGKLIGPMEDIRFKSSADGREIQGWIQFPPDFDPKAKYPLALEIHGGPNTDYGPMFSITHQIYAAAGYIVLFTNPRGSIGYGEEFANLINDAYPGADYDDLMSGVDAMAARPYVDSRNLFIGGGSGGGVLTSWAIGKTDRFNAASVLRPVTDWTVQALTSDVGPETIRYWLQGAPWDIHEEYWRRSPLSLVGNVKTPTVLITGEADHRAPIAQTEMYFEALKTHGVDAMMVRLPGANHGMGRPSQWLESILAVVDWYDRYRVKTDP